MACCLSASVIPSYSYYAFQMVGKYLKGYNSKVYFGDYSSGIYLTMVEKPDGNFAIIMVNMDIMPQDFKVTLSKKVDNTKLYRSVYDPSTIKRTTAARPIEVSTIVNNFTDTLFGSLPAGGVVVYSTEK